MNTYFKIKIFTEYIIPIVFVTVIFVIKTILDILRVTKENRIHNFFLSHGYERTLLGVPSVGYGVFYGWVRKCDSKVVDDRDIRGLSLKQIKAMYK